MSRLIHVDLGAGAVESRPVEPALTAQFLGGRGLGAALLWQYLADPANPLAPENPLIFAVGPFTGTPWPTGARTHVTFYSPLTGIYGYANAGGQFGAALRRADVAALVVTGRAAEPVVLEVTPAGARIRPAGELWGRGTHAATEALAAGGARVACIGPAGERGVPVAAIMMDGDRAAARCGGGAVMGSKHLKAVVVPGSRAAPALPPAFVAEARRAFQQVRDHPHVTGLRDLGTVFLVAGKNLVGDLPAYNHQRGQIDHVERIDAQAIARHTVATKGCYACPIRCGRVTRVLDGPHAGDLQGPEYESLDALGPMCGIDDPAVILHANRLCNDLGLDTISTGVTVAFAMECRQHGLLHDAVYSLEWGDADTLLGLIQDLAARRGLGDLLAGGVRRAAAAIGGDAPRYAMHVKGLELPRQEPRVAKGFGLGHATANRGADHLYALPTIDLAGNLDAASRFFAPDVVPALMETDNETYKPDLVVFSEHVCAVSDALGVCKFTTAETYALYPEDLARGLSALWGQEVSADELLAAGERIVNLERLYNVRRTLPGNVRRTLPGNVRRTLPGNVRRTLPGNARLGLSRADDRLPARFTTEPLPALDARLRDFDAMLDRYYHLRGWDANGIPTPETLRRLGLDEFAG